MTTASVPAISVLMSARNEERYIEQALQSLAAQTFQDFEIILIENGSTDSTSTIVAEWEKREPRLRVFGFRRPSLARSHNFGGFQARAPLLARLDADDVAHPERLEIQHRVMSERPSIGVLGSAARFIDAKGRGLGEFRSPLTHRELRAMLSRTCPFIHSTVMMRSQLFRQVGGYRPGLNIGEDYDLWCRLADHCEFANLPFPLISYRAHRTSLTSRHPARGGLSSLCINAAREARRAGLPEPFLDGVPNLRRIPALLGLPPEECRAIIRLLALRSAISRRWFTLPIPAFVKTHVRAIAISLRLRPVCLALARRLAGQRSVWPPERPEASETALQEVCG